MHNIIKPIPLNKLSNEPLVSVWMTNYNYANFLDESINSVLNQTYSKFELIICDDGSKDDSVDIIQEFCNKNNRVKFIKKKNGGPTSSLNKIYDYSNGEIICFLDADDSFAENKLEMVVKNFKEKPKGGVHFHAMMRINENGKHEGRYPLISKIPNGFLTEDVLKNSTGFLNIPPMSGISLRRELTEIIFPIYDEVKTNSDAFLINTSLLLSCAISNETVLGNYRLHNKNLTNFSLNKNGITELIKMKEKDISLNLMIYNAVNKWLYEKINPQLKLGDINNNWFYIEDKYVIILLKEKSLKSEIEYWKSKLLSHHLTKSSNHLYYFYKFLKFLPRKSIKSLLLLKYSQGKTKNLVGKILNRNQ